MVHTSPFPHILETKQIMKHIKSGLKFWIIVAGVIFSIPLSQVLWYGGQEAIIWAKDLTKKVNYEVSEPFAKAEEPDKLEAKIEELKEDILNQLANCETGGVDEPNGYVKLDSNAVNSWGKYQWQRKSIQHWVKEFYDRDVNLQEAALIAWGLHEIPLDELTWKTLEVRSAEWYNCDKRLGLEKQVSLVKKISN